MKKRFRIMLAIVIATVFCAGTAMAQSGKVIKWKMVSTWPPSIDFIEIDRNFVKIVNELSNGRLQITMSPAGELVPPTAVFDTVSKGSVECGTDSPLYWAGKNSAFEILGSIPMGLAQYDYINWYYHYGGQKIASDLYNKYNLVYFLTAVSPMESGIRSRMPLKTLADYKGKKFRMSGKAQGHILKKLGAAQVMVSGGEIYQALQLGTIDAAEFSCPSLDWKMGFGEVTKYNIGPGWHQPSSTFGVLINKHAWESLPADLKGIVETAAQANVAFMSGWYEIANIKALEEFKRKGTQVFRLSDKDLKTIEQYTWEYLVDECKKNPDYHKAALSVFQYLKDFRNTRDYERPFGQGRNTFTVPNIPGLK